MEFSEPCQEQQIYILQVGICKYRLYCDHRNFARRITIYHIKHVE